MTSHMSDVRGQSNVSPTGTALLAFKQTLNLSKKKELREGLSSVLRIGPTLWVTNDEMLSLERLSVQGKGANGTYQFGDHTQFKLDQYLQLPVPPPADAEDSAEADIEGLAYSAGYLWLVGSHSHKRQKPEKKRVKKNFACLARVSSGGNHFLLARIPVVAKEGTYTLQKEVAQEGQKRTAAQLRGDDKSSELTDAVAQDEHLHAFCHIPGKDNGFDIEGLAVVGERLFLGLRGPVLRGWAVILEVELEEGKGSTLKLKKIGPGGRRYRKHFLQLAGLGIRDLCVCGPDLLILAGPTMDMDGPVMLFRWPDGTRPRGESMVFAEQLPMIMGVPYGQGKNKGKDHAEGLTLFDEDARSILVVYDSVTTDRKHGDDSVAADLFALSR